MSAASMPSGARSDGARMLPSFPWPGANPRRAPSRPADANPTEGIGFRSRSFGTERGAVGRLRSSGASAPARRMPA